MKKILFFNILVWPVVVFLSIPQSFGQLSGVTVVSRDGQNLRLYDDYQAVVVGVSDYRSWPKLPGAGTDASAIAKQLKKIGFNVKLVMDPTFRQLKATLTDLINPVGNRVNRGVLFYYIGHGATAKFTDNTRMGYIIPVDCPPLSQNPDGFLRHAISMKEIEAVSTRIKAKHVIMLFDACFSGSQFVIERPTPEAITSKSNMPVRQYIIAGRENEKPSKQRMFNRCVLMGLDGYADLSDDGYITGSELALYLADIVANSTQRKQHPQYGKINHPSLDKGDFVFVTAKGLVKVSEDSERQKKLEEEIKALDAAILKAKSEQKRMEAKRTSLVRELKALGVEPSPEKEVTSREQPASEASQLEKKSKMYEAQRQRDAPAPVKASSSASTDDVQRQLKRLQERTKMLEERYEKLKKEQQKEAYEKPPESRSTEGLKDDLDMLRERKKMLEEQRRMLKTEKEKEAPEEEEPGTIWGGGDDPREPNLLGGP